MNTLVPHLQINIATVQFCVVGLATLIAGVTDIKSFKVHNWLTFPLIVTGIVFNSFAPGGAGAAYSLVGAAFGFGILFLFFAGGIIGAGDVKLLTGIGAWIGPHDVLVVFIVSGLLTGVYSLAIILFARKPSSIASGVATTPGANSLLRETTDGNVAGADENGDEVSQQVGQSRRRAWVPMAAMMAAAVVILVCAEL